MPEVGLVADVSIIAGLSLGVTRDEVPVTTVVPPPGRLPIAWAVYVVPGVRLVTGQSKGLTHVTIMGLPPATGVSVTV